MPAGNFPTPSLTWHTGWRFVLGLVAWWWFLFAALGSDSGPSRLLGEITPIIWLIFIVLEGVAHKAGGRLAWWLRRVAGGGAIVSLAFLAVLAMPGSPIPFFGVSLPLLLAILCVFIAGSLGLILVACSALWRLFRTRQLPARRLQIANLVLGVFFIPMLIVWGRNLGPSHLYTEFVHVGGGRDRSGKSGLMDAAERGDEAKLHELLRGGADVNARDDLGQTALHVACRDREGRAVRPLIRAGANVNARDFGGQTPLLVAVEYHNSRAVRVLVEAGADVNARDSFDRTALAWVELDGPPSDRVDAEIARILREAGATQ